MLPEQVRKALQAAGNRTRDSMETRDRLIRAAYAEYDTSLREIAGIVGLEHTGVRRIVQRGEREEA